MAEKRESIIPDLDDYMPLVNPIHGESSGTNFTKMFAAIAKYSKPVNAGEAFTKGYDDIIDKMENKEDKEDDIDSEGADSGSESRSNWNEKRTRKKRKKDQGIEDTPQYWEDPSYVIKDYDENDEDNPSALVMKRQRRPKIYGRRRKRI